MQADAAVQPGDSDERGLPPCAFGPEIQQDVVVTVVDSEHLDGPACAKHVDCEQEGNGEPE